MTTNEQAVASAMAEPTRAILNRSGSAWAFSEQTPLVVSALGVLLVLCLTGAALVTHRLEEVASARVVRSTGLSQPSTVSRQEALDFTLASQEVRRISADEARVFNAGVPFSTLPILAAKPFLLPADRLEDYARALDCLTAAVYHEAASETAEGQAGVAQVVLNRVRHPAYPNTVCGVVFEGAARSAGCQFSFTCDGALARRPTVEGWARARAVASAALNGSVAASVGMATHYHADWVAPFWAERLVKMRQIGVHIFYRWAGTWGLPSAFTARYGDVEPVIPQMAALSAPAPVLAPEVVIALPRPLEHVDPILPKAAAPVVETFAADPEPSAVEAAVPASTPVPVPTAGSTLMPSPLSPTPGTQPPRRRSRIATPF